MKLYEVEITIRAVVQAESLEDAYGVSRYNLGEMMDEAEINVIAEIVNEQSLPEGYDDRCYPYWQGYGIPEKTIAQIWEEQG